MDIKENIPLAPLTTFRVGGNARYFAEIKEHKELAELASFASAKNVPIFILGSGSNILVHENGFSGLVIKPNIKGISMKPVAEKSVAITAGAGELWDDLVSATVEAGLYGLENLSGIPGTVGAAPVQNIGAYGSEVGKTISQIEVYDLQSGETKVIEGHDCAFGYRDSIFKQAVGKNLVITRVTFLLTQDGDLNTDYADFTRYAEQHASVFVTPRDVRSVVLAIRRNKLPDLREYGTAGSFFKNPRVGEAELNILKVKFPNLPSYQVENGRIKIPLAWILDKVCGLRGWRDGNVGAYKNQPLVLVNYGNAKATEIASAAEKVTKIVKAKTGVNISPEVVYVGF
jgi:UDP-N-acetylmuramate dehydrogenase